MATLTNISNPGLLQGGTDNLAGYLKVFSGEVLTAFERSSKAVEKHIVRTISSGKSASFPVMGRANAHYLQPGQSLDDIREVIPHNEKIIGIDGLLTSDQLITDLYEAMSHYDVRQEYAKQMGEALALAADGSIIAEIAKLATANTENITGLGKGIVLEKQIAAGDIGVTEAMGKTIVQMLLELKAKFSNQYVPDSERYVYMKPEGIAALINSWTAINRDFGAVGTIVEGNITRLAGFDIIEVPHLTTGGVDGANVLKSGASHDFPTAYKDKAVFVAAHHSAVGTVKLKDLSLETGRRIELQADHVVAKYSMGHGGLRPEATAIGTISASTTTGK